MSWILFTWELSRKAGRRRWFYVQLYQTLSELPAKSWRKVGGSVYVVKAEHAHEFENLLKGFESPDLRWPSSS